MQQVCHPARGAHHVELFDSSVVCWSIVETNTLSSWATQREREHALTSAEILTTLPAELLLAYCNLPIFGTGHM